MISIDITPFEDAGRRTRDRRNDATTCGYCKQRVPRGHECEQKREAMKERPCALPSCAKPFKPKVHGQAYCCHNHKRMNRNQRDYSTKRSRQEKPKAGGPKVGGKSELNTIAPLERAWARAGQQAAQYVPVMGEPLVEATLRLMR